MKAPTPWNTYRTRFLVKAKQLTASLAFTDDLGRQHCGARGDYLVESSDGVLSITPRRIFEDVYVALPSESRKAACDDNGPSRTSSPCRTLQPDETSRPYPSAALSIPPYLVRKSPQPYRDRRTSEPGARSL